MKGMLLLIALVGFAAAQYEAEDYATALDEPEHFYNSETEIDQDEEHKKAKQAHLERILAEEKHYALHHKAIMAREGKKKVYHDDPEKLIDAKTFHETDGVRFDDFDDEEAHTLTLSEKESKYAQRHALEDKVNWSLERAKATREIVALEREALLSKGHKLEHAHGHDEFLVKEKKDGENVLVVHKTEANKRSAMAATTVVSAVAMIVVVLAAAL